MSTFDRDAVIEQAAKAMHDAAKGWTWERLCAVEPTWAEQWRETARPALPVIVDAALAPIEALLPDLRKYAPDWLAKAVEDRLTEIGEASR